MEFLTSRRSGRGKRPLTVRPYVVFVAAALLVFTRVLAGIVGDLGSFGLIAWTAFYVSSLLFLTTAIDRLGEEPHEAEARVVSVAFGDEIYRLLAERELGRLAS